MMIMLLSGEEIGWHVLARSALLMACWQKSPEPRSARDEALLRVFAETDACVASLEHLTLVERDVETG